MTKLVALDTETTSLRRDGRIWEVGAIVRPDHRSRDGEQEHRWFIRAEDLDLGNADPFSLDKGRFYERHPQMASQAVRRLGEMPGGGAYRALPEDQVMGEVEEMCRKAHIVGAVVNFDTQRLDARMAAHGIFWNGHYHLIDVEGLTVGYLNGMAAVAREAAAGGWAAPQVWVPDLPWDSEKLSEALSVKTPGDARHTALGDARWALDIYDKVTGIE
jgi:DNA polymerase III epsilon subunit-like protein